MLTREENELLTRTGPSTAMGEYFRRFWQPVALSSELAEPDGPPLRLTVMGEELVAFRDKVQVVAHESPNPDSVVTITTRDGSTHRDAVNVAIPERDLDAQWEKLEHKFHALVDERAGRAHADELVGLVRTLETQDDLGDFFSLLRVER